ncbi:MAG: cadherin domain-containing protein [Bacteroidota bacterium]
MTTPTVISVEVPTNATYTNGAELEFEVSFSEVVVVSGNPRLELIVGSVTALAAIKSGSGSETLVFSYTVQSGDLDQDGIDLGQIDLNGGSIQDILFDDADLTLNNVEDLSGVRIDAVIPEITSVNVPGDATYRQGETLSFTVNFDDVVFVFGANPALLLDIGGTTVGANYTGGFFGTSLTFNYTIQSGELDLDGIEVVSLSGGSITDQAGNQADRTLNNLEDTQNVLVDARGPVVLSVSGPADDTYAIGETLAFSVLFDEVVMVSGSPQLSVDIGSSSVIASLTGGSGSSTLTFSYTIQNGDEDTDGVEVIALGLNGGTIQDGLSNDANLILNNIADLTGVLVDGIIPTVVSVIVPPAGNYGEGQDLDFTVNFSEPVNVVGSPQLSFTIGGSNVFASFSGGSGTSSLDFSYTVLLNDEDTDGLLINSLGLNGGSIADVVGNNADIALQNIEDASGVLVDAVVATVLSVAVPADDTYGAGDVLLFTVEFSEVVVVVGTPQLSITIGTTTVNADYFSGTTSDEIIFSYTVQQGESDNDGISVNSLGLNGGSIEDLAGNNASLILNNIEDASGVLVDGINPVITAVEVPDDGVYATGDLLDFRIIFNEDMRISGSPQLSILIGTATVQASFTDGDGTNTISFEYTIQAGEQDLDGIDVTAITLNGGSITDLAGTNADLTLNNVEDASNVLVDAVLPVITNVSVPANDTYAIGETLSFEVSFDDDVDVTGTPLLSFLVGLSSVDATFVNGSGTPTLGFTYTVQDGDEDIDGITLVSLDLNGGMIADDIGNPADLALNNIEPTGGVLVDGIIPEITSVNIPADDTYMTGDALVFTVNFDDNVVVSGGPEFSFTIGSNTVLADFVGGSATTALTFSYTIVADEADADGIAINGINLNGGTIKDDVGNDADLTLNNVDDPSGVLIDAVTPTVIISSGEISPTSANPITIQVQFSEAVSGFLATDVVLSGGSATNFSGTGALYFFDLIPSADGVISIDVPAGVASDNAGNSNQASSTFNIESDQTEPSGYLVSMELGVETIINTANQAAIEFSITGGEVNTTLTYEFRDVDGLTVTGTESVTSPAQTFSNGGAGYDLTSLANGTITLTIFLTDAAGNQGLDANTSELKDVSPPTGYSLSWDDSLIGLAEATTTSFTISNGEDGTTLQYNVSSAGGGSIGPFSVIMDASNSQVITIDVSSLSDGVLTAEGRLIDSENNQGILVSNNNTTLDQTPPAFNTVSDAGDGNYRAGEVIQLFADMSEAGLTLNGDISIYDATFSNAATFSDNADGTYSLNTPELDLTGSMIEGIAITLTVDASDAAGNTTADNSLTLLLDKTAPSGYAVAFDDLLYSGANVNNASFTISSGEVGSEFQYEITSSGGATSETGTGSVSDGASQQVSGIDLESLADGDLTLSLVLTDVAGNSGSASVFTSSEKITSPPTIVGGQTFNISESAANGDIVGSVAATDPASLPLSNWNITSGNTGGVFQIESTSGELSILDNSTLDFELLSSYNLMVTVSNGFAASAEESVLVNVVDNNDSPPSVNPGQAFNVDENTAPGTVIGVVAASDADAGTVFDSWTLVSSTLTGALEINPNTGTLSILDNAFLDFELIQSITIAVSVRDGVNTSPGETVIISINDLNDNSPVVTPGQLFTLPNPIAAGAPVGTALATDADTGSTLANWAIVGGNDDGLFSINATSGEITLAAGSGFDAGSYQILVTVSDGTNLSAAESITLEIGDTTSPSVVLSSSASEATNERAQEVVATFSEAVTPLMLSDISVSGGIISNLVTLNNISFTFDLDISAEGPISLNIPADVVADNAGNTNLASNTLNFLFDETPPVAVITTSSDPVTNAETADLSIEFSENVLGFSLSSLAGINVSFENLVGASPSYDLEASSGEGMVTVSLPAGAVVDLAGNENIATEISWEVDLIAPSAYSVQILNEAINTLNQDNLRFQILNGEANGSYDFTITRLGTVAGSGQLQGDGGVTTVENIDVSELEDGTLTVSVTTSDAVGNMGLPVQDEVIKNTEVEIPQGFNPDRELWIIPGITDFPNNKVVIFNRFGTKVWEIERYNNQDKAWNGSSNASTVVGSGGAPDGTYFYVIEFQDGALPVKSGFVLIKR